MPLSLESLYTYIHRYMCGIYNICMPLGWFETSPVWLVLGESPLVGMMCCTGTLKNLVSAAGFASRHWCPAKGS